MMPPVIETTVYEVGFLLVPLLPETELEAKVEELIKAKITAASGAVISTVAPRLLPLAYPMAKAVENKKTVYQDAFFGAVKFSLSPEALADLHLKWQTAPEIIRHLIIKVKPEKEPELKSKAGEAETKLAEAAPVEAKSEVTPATGTAVALDAVIDRELAEMLE